MSTAFELAERFDSLEKLKQAIEAEASAYFRHDEMIKQACQLLASQDTTAEARTKHQLQGIDCLRGCDAVRFIPAYFQQWATNVQDRDAAVMGEMMKAAIEGNAEGLKQLNELVDRLPDRNIMAQIQAAFGRTLAEAILRSMRPELREQGLAKVNEEVSRLKLTRNDVTDLADVAGISDGARHFIRCIEKAWREQEAAKVERQPSVRAQGTKTATHAHPKQRRDVNPRMISSLQANPEAVGWTAKRWAEHLQCAPSSVVATQTWKALELQRVENRLKNKPDRRGRNIRTITE